MEMKFTKGFMNVFFVGGLMVLLLCTLVLTEEASRMRLKRNELEKMLAFDYRVEAYYLLLISGSISLEEDKAFGSLVGYELMEDRVGENYILIENKEERIVITGHFRGEERGFYEISK